MSEYEPSAIERKAHQYLGVGRKSRVVVQTCWRSVDRYTFVTQLFEETSGQYISVDYQELLQV